MTCRVDRRSFIKTSMAAGATAAAGASLAAAGRAAAAEQQPAPVERRYQAGRSPWPLVLNTSTIRPASLAAKLDAAEQAGYDGVELWVNELEAHEEAGGSLEALREELSDRGLMVPNLVALWNALPPTREAFVESMPATRERMRRAAAVGASHAAAFPSPDRPDFDLGWGAEMYRELLRIGREDYGITVAIEFIGQMQGLNRLGLAAALAIDADDPDACIVNDTFHLYRGGSGFEGLRHLRGSAIAVFHWNDVPASPPRTELTDAHRIYPGDGILPLTGALRCLSEIGYSGPISLELFNREHWEQPPADVARTGIEKMRANIEAALG